jgi:hypothetical protein
MAPCVYVPANLSYFRVFICPASSFLIVNLFQLSFSCPIKYNLINAQNYCKMSIKTNYTCCPISNLFLSSSSHFSACPVVSACVSGVNIQVLRKSRL